LVGVGRLISTLARYWQIILFLEKWSRPMKHAINIALLASALSFHCLAQAGQMTLYTDANFGGRAVTVQHQMPDLSGVGFNDRASSMVIDAGRWEVCVDAGFRGRCALFERGQYPVITGLNDSISSVREVGGVDQERGRERDHEFNRGRDHDRDHERERERDHERDHERDDHQRRDDDGRGDQGWQGLGQERNQGQYQGRNQERSERQWRAGPQPVVLLYSEPGFRGERLPLQRDERNLDQFNFNDRAASVVIQEGEWELCMHADFRGQCRLYGPGQYPRLGPLDGQVSSLRRVR
jgi:hypothetical protein